MIDEGFRLNTTHSVALIVSVLSFVLSLSFTFMLVFDDIVKALAVSLPSAFSIGVAFYYAFKEDAGRAGRDR